MAIVLLGPPLLPAVFYLIGCLLWGRTLARQWRLLAWYYGTMAGLTPISILVFLSTKPPLPILIIADACMLILWACGFVVTGYLYFGHSDQRAIERRHRCRKCEYDLTANVSGRCPECGEAIPFKQRVLLYLRFGGGEPLNRSVEQDRRPPDVGGQA